MYNICGTFVKWRVGRESRIRMEIDESTNAIIRLGDFTTQATRNNFLPLTIKCLCVDYWTGLSSVNLFFTSVLEFKNYLWWLGTE